MRFHPESPDLGATDLSRLRFVTDLKRHLFTRTGKGNRLIYEKRLSREGDRSPSENWAALRRTELRLEMEKEPFFQAWSSILRASQDLMWACVGRVVDTQRDMLEKRYQARTVAASGTLLTNPRVEVPSYLTCSDTHRMPGSYYSDTGHNDLRAGAVYDLGGAIYQLGLGNDSGALLNDSRGRTVVSHLRQYYPSFTPSRILDMGCSAGHNTVPLSKAFPGAEIDAIDIGAPMLRYAHLRAEGLGAKINFSQQNAEHTDFDDKGFDLVLSQIVLHETTPQAVENIIAESYRLVREGGIVIHLEVPIRYEHADVFDQFFRSWEQYYNNENNIEGVAAQDFRALAQSVGLNEILCGYQPIPPVGSTAASPLSETPISGHATWFIVSGRRPDVSHRQR